jgi:phenylpropionate dioxygenase-like ring-hydroxylating dioxygenase large terminal subunit
MANPVPEIPSAWHFVGESRAFGPQPGSFKLYDKEFVVFRDSKGELAVLSAHCPHMGANLCMGKVSGDRLVCPFHEWEFGVDGRCAHIPAQEEIPSWGKLARLPVVERHGIAFAWYGSKEPLWELPFFEGCDPADFFRANIQRVHQEGHWSIVPANAFDIPHLIHVHKRLPITPPHVRDPHPYCRHISHHYKIADSTLIDRVIRWIYGSEARMHFTSWGGSFTFVVTEFGQFKNYMMIILEPVWKGRSRSNVFVFSAGAGRGAFYRFRRRLMMRFQAFASRKFFQREADSLKDIRLSIPTLVESDRVLREYLEWLIDLYAPAGAASARPAPKTPKSEEEARREGSRPDLDLV